MWACYLGRQDALGMAQGMKQTDAQVLLAIHLRELGVHTQPEYLFCDRNWRFDLYSMAHNLAFEANGGKWHGGHRRGKAIEDENDKLNTATMLGYRVLQFTNEQILDGRAKAWLKEWLSK